jgi:RND superfamily putative drug exporter
MSRIREEAHRLPLREAGGQSRRNHGNYCHVGRARSRGELRRVRDRRRQRVGVGLAVGVLMDTFVVRTVLVPCTVVLLGRWNWWPAKLGVRTPATDDLALAGQGVNGDR